LLGRKHALALWFVLEWFNRKARIDRHMPLSQRGVERGGKNRDINVHGCRSQSERVATVTEAGDVAPRDGCDVQLGAVAKERHELPHRLLVPLSRRGGARLLLLVYEMIEPLLDSEHVQPFTVDRLQDFGEQLACPRFGHRAAPRFVRRLLQAKGHLQGLASAR
jgi:hypothetical protein